MTEAIFRRVGMTLVPVDDEARELLLRVKEGRDVGCDVIARRNPRHHRLFFAILKFVKLHCSLFENATLDDIKDAVKLATGCATKFVNATTGQTYYVLDSISFAAMDQTRFSEFFQNACDVVAQRWMPAGTTSEDVYRELIEMVDGPHAVQRRA